MDETVAMSIEPDSQRLPHDCVEKGCADTKIRGLYHHPTQNQLDAVKRILEREGEKS